MPRLYAFYALAIVAVSCVPQSIAGQATSPRELTLTMDLVRASGPAIDPRLGEISDATRTRRVLSELRRLFELEGFEILDTASIDVQLSSEPELIERTTTIPDLGELVMEVRISAASGVPDADLIQITADLTGAVTRPLDVSLLMRNGRTAALVFPGQPDGRDDYLVFVVSVQFIT